MPKDYQGDKVLELNKQVIKLTEDVQVRDGLLAQMASETGNEIKRLREALDEAVTKLSGAPNTNQYEWEHWRVEFCIKHKKGA